MPENEPARKVVREPINRDKPWEFISNFLLVLGENGLEHRYYADGAGFSFELSDRHRFTRHEILERRKLFSRKIPFWRVVAKILSESPRDTGPSIFSQLLHGKLVIKVIQPKDRPLIEKVVNDLHEIYPEEPIVILS